MTQLLWVGPVETEVAPPGERGAFWLRTEFAHARGSHASLRCSARGLMEVFADGSRVGDELLPGFTQYNHHLPLRTFDISATLLPGDCHSVVVLLADGWFRGQVGAPRASDQWGTTTSVWIELEIDGLVVAATDTTWRCAPSHVHRADLISGQAEDRRLFDAAVLEPGFDDSNWNAALLIDPPGVPLVPYLAPPVRRVEELVPIAVHELRPQVHVVDLGQNINGWVRLSNLGPAGTALTLTHGEWLDADGDVTQRHLEVHLPFLPHPLAAGMIDEVVSSGVPGDVFEPRLTTHGFRYVRIEGHTGPLSVDDIRGVVVHSDLRRTGWFRCDEERVNKLHDAAVWSLRGNVCEIPTDCPQRERAGWTGDWQIFAPTAAFLFDVSSFTRKWLADVRADQRADGAIANMSPCPRQEGFDGPIAFLQASAGWGDVIIEAPWALYEATGDVTALEECWEAAERWLAFAATSAANNRSQARIAASPNPRPHEQFLWDTGFHWGEWLEPGDSVGDFPSFVKADKAEVATAYLHRSALRMAQAAVVLGKPETVVERYRSLAAGALQAWQLEFIAADGSLRTQTQASHVRALMFGLVPASSQQVIADRLAALVRAAGVTVGTGFLSTGMLLPALALNGHVDLAEELLLQPNAPGWLHMIDRGSTTVWERWEGVDADGVPHESLNHYSKAAVVSYLHRHLGGLVPTSPGYRTFEVRPLFGTTQRFGAVELTHDTPHGRIDVRWTRDAGSDITIQVVVPQGTQCTLHLPGTAPEPIGPGDHTRRVTLG